MSSLWRISEKQLPDISKIKDEFLNHLDDIQTLTMDEVIEKLNQDEITFIDVRPADEYEAGHIPGAVSVPMDDLEQFMAKMPQGVEIIAYCRGPLCVMSALAAEKFKAHGSRPTVLRKVFMNGKDIFRSGIDYPIVKISYR